MKRSRIIPAVLTALFAGACEVPAPPPKAAIRLPKEVCDQVTAGMEKLKQSGVDQVKPGEITMVEQAWLELPAAQRDQMVQLIAFDAACRADQPSAEQTVVVRSEYGRPMAQRIVTTSADLSDLTGS